MIIARTSQRRTGALYIYLLAASGMACGGGGTAITGTGGASGSAGTTGAAGTTGGAGTTGNAGTSGNAGSSGSAGTSGNAGTSGAAGTSGNAGASGSAGTTGSAGAVGTAGTTGSGGGAGGRGGTTTGTAGSSGGRGGNGGSTGGSGAGGAAGGAMPSAGCTSATGAPASGHFTIDASGTQREYIIKIPTGYDPRHPYRLVIAFHGRMYDAVSVDAGGPPTAAGQGAYYGIEPRAGGSTIFVAAQALSTSWTNANDVPYVNAMIARFKTDLCIDQSRIFATGFSMGAIQTILLGCGEADLFRAIAAMSGSIQGTCSGTTPIGYFGSHGTNDPTIPIATGRMVRDTFRMRNHCTTTTVAASQAGCVDYQGCDPGKPVSWCEFDGVHEPPPYSGDVLWKFLSQF